MNTGERLVPSNFGLLTTIAYKFGGGACHTPRRWSRHLGALVQWLRDNLGLIQKSSDVEAACTHRQRTTAAVYFVPAFSRSLAPYGRRMRGVDRRADPLCE